MFVVITNIYFNLLYHQFVSKIVYYTYTKDMFCCSYNAVNTEIVRKRNRESADRKNFMVGVKVSDDQLQDEEDEIDE